MKKFLLKPAISAALLAIIAQPHTAAAAKVESGWVLLQRTPIGMYNVFIAKNKVRIEEAKTHYFIISKAPDWNVYAFRKDHRTICKVSPQKWEAEGLFTMNERNFVKKVNPKVKPSSRSMDNINYLEYKIPLRQARRFANGKVLNMTAFMSPETNVKKIYSTETDLLVSPTVSTDPNIARVLGSLFVVPIGAGAPIKFTIKYDNGAEHNPLLTARIRQAPLQADLFQVPIGYKTVANIQRITTGYRAGEIDDMINDLGLGNSFGKDKKNKKP